MCVHALVLKSVATNTLQPHHLCLGFAGMPAVRNGELPLGWGSGGLESLPEGFAILGFAFYMQVRLLCPQVF